MDTQFFIGGATALVDVIVLMHQQNSNQYMKKLFKSLEIVKEIIFKKNKNFLLSNLLFSNHVIPMDSWNLSLQRNPKL